MKIIQQIFCYGIALFCILRGSAQTFTRSELPTTLAIPWEIIYGPDGWLYVNDSGGRVSRVNPLTGTRYVVWTASDYFPGDSMEKLQACFKPDIGAGTLGMALHPDFLNPLNSFIYLVYSYNQGSQQSPNTNFKIVRLAYSAVTGMAVSSTDIVTQLSTGYDHLGGRLMIIPQNGTNYIFLSIGDHGVSETNAPDCYTPQLNNPNNYAQEPGTQNGKIHRFNMDGSIPTDNPITGNSFYTRGHRNPQGLMYNADKGIIYDTEHGDRTDDEINVLVKGMNYGWKTVRGYHTDNNYPGEVAIIANYQPDANIVGDELRPPLFSWCDGPQPTDPEYLNWCTVAPSGGEYYNSMAIPEWTNSLLVTTLKNGSTTDQQVYRFRLSPSGTSLVAGTPQDPNPQKFFGADQAANGRLRDIAVSPDGKKIFLINNFGNVRDHITVYTYNQPTGITVAEKLYQLKIYPNPVEETLHISCNENIEYATVCDMAGHAMIKAEGRINSLDIRMLPVGIYLLKLRSFEGHEMAVHFIRN